MRKLYALLTGFVLTLFALTTNANPVTPDVANFTFAIDAPNNNVGFVNTSSLGNEPGDRRAFWSFGDGSGTMTPPLQGTQHHYQSAGTYTVCLKIFRYRPNLHDSVLSAQICKTVVIETICRANFETLATAANPLGKYFIAQPGHNQNKKPVRICWTFGDGRDTCIQYPANYTGNYAVYHLYNHPDNYNVCVKIYYDGGCLAQSCHIVPVIRPDVCAANFERMPPVSILDPLKVYFKALTSHNNNRKPARICWTFGDGRDTCINYTEAYTGSYVVNHLYNHPGQYEVCVKILYFGGCEARKCNLIQVTIPDVCHADFERIPVASNPLLNYFKALPDHNNNRKPARICWTFGDGRDTCINYTEAYTGLYAVSHLYNHPGQYEVCVRILYFGGCEARKCKEITVPPPPVTCAVNLFELTPSITSLVRGFLAVPHTEPTRRPERICWTFGDGEDTCIMIDPQQPLPDFIIRHTYPAPGVYRACVRIRFQGGCIAEKCIEVVIRPSNNICGGYMTDSLIAPRAFKFKGYSIHNPNDEAIAYRWTFGDGTSASGREVTHTYNQGGSYQVCLTIVTRLGCETRICKTVRVPGNNEPALRLTPNPVVNVLHVEFRSTHTEQVNIKILNGFGAPVRTYVRNVTVGQNNWDVELATLMPGIYTFIVQSPNQLASAIFIKQ
jgi:PKD domain